MDCTICVAKTKVLISCAVTAQLICVFVFANAKTGCKNRFFANAKTGCKNRFFANAKTGCKNRFFANAKTGCKNRFFANAKTGFLMMPLSVNPFERNFANHPAHPRRLMISTF